MKRCRIVYARRVSRRALRLLFVTTIAFVTACGAMLDFDDDAQAPGPRADASDARTGPSVEAGADASDDGAVGDAGADAPRGKIVFVTGGKYLGGMGGVDGGDDICNDEAASVGLPRTFVAYLRPSAAGDPLQRLPDGGARWSRVDGQLAFSGGAGQAPLVPVILTPDGGTIATGDLAWTGAGIDPGNHCPGDGGAWQNTGASLQASCGDPSTTDRWRYTGLEPCNTRQHLYCFER